MRITVKKEKKKMRRFPAPQWRSFHRLFCSIKSVARRWFFFGGGAVEKIQKKNKKYRWLSTGFSETFQDKIAPSKYDI